jgi:serine/threonine-protein kinase HipA
MIRKITIQEHTTGRALPVGELVSEISEIGKARCQFRYLDEFLGRNDAFPLDPVTLPLGSGSFKAEGKVVFDVLEDSLPDDWGRKLLVRRHNLPKGEQNPACLLQALGADGLGALSFSGDTTKGRRQPKHSGQEASMLQLDRLVKEIERYERGDAGDPTVSLLLSAGSSPGGARPKVLVSDDPSGGHYLAKFPSIKDTVDVVRIEGATMSLAARAGLNTPPTRIVVCAGRPVLLVRRFDLLPGGRRRHMISFRSLLQAEAYSFSSYGELHAVVRKYSSEPAEDAEQLFRQMVFNSLMGNTDDHLKNFWMVYGQNEGWRLSPSFDLVPNIARRAEHVLNFDLDPRHPGRQVLTRIGRSWGVRGSASIVDEIYATVADWKTLFSDTGVPDGDIATFGEIDDNLFR